MCVATRPAITPLFPAVFPTRYLTPEESSPSILAPRRGTGMWLFNASPERETASTKPGLGGTSSLPPLTFVARMTDVQRYGLFVGGEFVPAHSGATFPVHNPHNDEVFAQVAEAREDDVEDAIAAARSAFEGPWGALTPKERGKLLLRLARLIEDQGELIARLEAKNSGHPIRDVRRFDLVRTVDWFQYFAGMTTKIQGATRSASPVPSKSATRSCGRPRPP